MSEIGAGMEPQVEAKEVQVAQTPLVKSITDLEEVIQGEDPDKLFLRWTPDIEADMMPGAVSRNLSSHDPEAGISAYEFNPFPETGYGLRENYRYAAHYGSQPKERKYYLLKAEQILDESGRPVIGTNAEPLLKPETIQPLAEISPDALDEAYYRGLAYEAVQGDHPTYLFEPGQKLKEMRDVMASWTIEKESAAKLRDRTLKGIDVYLESKAA